MTPRDMYTMLARRCGLTTEDTGYAYDDGRNVWEHRVQAAFAHAKLRGDVTTKKPGWWELTERGREKCRLSVDR